MGVFIVLRSGQKVSLRRCEWQGNEGAGRRYGANASRGREAKAWGTKTWGLFEKSPHTPKNF